jgi:hypothetical protein
VGRPGHRQGQIGTGVQSTLAASSPNLIDWTRLGLAAEYVTGDMGDGHTGYFKSFWLAGTHYAYGLYGGGRWGRFVLWTRDDTAPGVVRFTPDRRQILGKVDLLGAFDNGIVGEPKTDPVDPDIGCTSTRIFSGGVVVQYRGANWRIGMVTASRLASGATQIGRLTTAPLRDDLLGISAAPIDITPPLQGWEKDAGIGLGNVFEYDGTTYICYRAGGTTGDIAVLEVY